jgi:hypothetical protein
VRLEELHEHPWGTESHAATKLLLPGAIRDVFGDDGLPNRHDLVDQAAMQTLAVRGESALAGGFAPPGGQIPLALFPPQALLPAFFDAPLRIEVVGVVGPALALHLALEPPDRLGIGGQLGAEHLQAWSARTGDDGKCRGSQVQANGVAPDRVLGFLIGHESRAPVARRSAVPLDRPLQHERWRPGAPPSVHI